jgi:hypothetical protein
LTAKRHGVTVGTAVVVPARGYRVGSGRGLLKGGLDPVELDLQVGRLSGLHFNVVFQASNLDLLLLNQASLFFKLHLDCDFPISHLPSWEKNFHVGEAKTVANESSSAKNTLVPRDTSVLFCTSGRAWLCSPARPEKAATWQQERNLQ